MARKIRKIPIEIIEEDYIICKEGYLVKKSSGEIIRGAKSKYGYFVVSIAKTKSSFPLHRIMLAKFCPNERECELEVNHIDMNKENNAIENLEWVTRSENVQKMYDSGVRTNFSKHRLTKDEIIGVYMDAVNGATNNEIAEKYNIGITTVVDIKYKRCHKELLEDLPEMPELSKTTSKVTKETARKIKEDLENGVKTPEICKKYNVDCKFVSALKNGKTFKDLTPDESKIEKYGGPAKLSYDDVRAIRADTTHTKQELADMYGVKVRAIYNVIEGNTYKYVK